MSDTAVNSKSRKPIIILVVLLVPVLIVLGIEGWRQADENSSVAEVESAYEDILAYFGDPDDWDQHFSNRLGGPTGYKEYHQLGKGLEGTLSGHGNLTEWAIASIENTEKKPTQEEAQTFLNESAHLPGSAQALLKFDYLDGTAVFEEDGNTAGEISGLYVQRTLQLRVALMYDSGSREQAMSELELLLELTARLQHPFGLMELLLMTVIEPTTHLLAGRLAEAGALSDRCNELLNKIAQAPETRLSVAEGEMAYFAWMYKVRGIDALSDHSYKGDKGGSTGWFQWFGESGFGGASGLNRMIAEDNRALLTFCEELKAGRVPTAVTGLPDGLMTNFDRSYSELKLQRDRSALLVRLRKAMTGGDPSTLADEAKKDGMILTKTTAGWRLAFTGDEKQIASIDGGAELFERRFAPLVLRN